MPKIQICIWYFQCVYPPPEEPTERPIPELPETVKMVTTIVTRTASIILISFVGFTLFLFASLKIYDEGRVIQMNMEIALILAHISLLIPGLYSDPIPLVRFIHKIRLFGKSNICTLIQIQDFQPNTKLHQKQSCSRFLDGRVCKNCCYTAHWSLTK